MSDIIQLLPDSVANQIAAGEVVQRPASVVKELMENAIDAGADHIQVVLKNVGKAIIQVIDNGKGMSPLDARMAFERHATSKIASAQDSTDFTADSDAPSKFLRLLSTLSIVLVNPSSLALITASVL